MSQRFLYFAYGSNLKHQQMEFRCPGSKYIKNYYLRDYELCFCWNGTSRSDGVANTIKISGSYVPGKFYRKNLKVKSLMIEINRGTYMDERTGTKGLRFEKIKRITSKILNEITQHL